MPVVLLIEDSIPSQVILGRVLEKLGYTVHCVETGVEAFHFTSKTKVDVIFLDHNLPGYDGFDTLQAIQAQANVRGVPVVMYTAELSAEYKQAALKNGAQAVLTKPFTQQELEAILNGLTETE